MGPRADPRQPHPAPARGDLRGARGHRRPRRGPATLRAPRRGARATCSSRSSSTPSSPTRRAGSPWPTSPAASTTSSSHRHPHVFGAGGRRGSADEVHAPTGRQLKRAEKGRTSMFEGIPAALPALAYAAKVQTQGGRGRLRLGRRRRRAAQDGRGAGRAGRGARATPDGPRRARRPAVRRRQRGPPPRHRPRRRRCARRPAKFRAPVRGGRGAGRRPWPGPATRSTCAALDALWDEVKRSEPP